ncbi:LuxR C-terminal-related transcriptional regulator [Kineococcus sp. SYSU DK004]|uniref:LuxR C-terminal-related transcriptional regulator n=1 Tax=Kineococcus sp. SYSU DK004 TaxID=3383125 RepID=UPI003D7D6EE3
MQQRRVRALDDLRAALLEAVAADAADLPVDAVAACLLGSGIAEQVSFQVMALDDAVTCRVRVWPDHGAEQRLLVLEPAEWAVAHPVARWQLSGGAAAVLGPEELSPRWRRSHPYRVVRQAVGITEQLCFPVQVRPGRAVTGFGVGRDGRAFSAGEREHVERVWRAVAAAQTTLARTSRLRRELERALRTGSGRRPGERPGSAREDAPDVAALTARERQVLDAVLSGAARRTVARELGISARTIDKHLEHVNAKLGTTSLLQAAHRLGVVGGREDGSGHGSRR